MHNSVFDREPPYSLEAEVSVLGSMLIDGDAIPSALEHLNEGHFWKEAHRRVYRAIGRIWEAGRTVDPVTLVDELKKHSELDQAGGVDYIGKLLEAVPSTANIEDYCIIVRDKAQLRDLLDACHQTIAGVYENGKSASDTIAEAESRISAVAQGGPTGYVWIKDELWKAFEEIERIQESQDGGVKVPWGIPGLDRMTLGLHPGDLTILAARPSMGKSALAYNLAANVAIQQYASPLIATYEMSRRQVVMRLAASEARVDLQKIRQGKLSREEHERLGNAAGHLNTARIFIDDGSDVSLATLVAKTQKAVRRDGVDLLIVDYLQLMSAGGGENRTLEIGKLSGGLKRLARRLDIPVVALSQLSRGVDSREDKRPRLSDIRQSGDVEQDADNVIFVYRPEYYAKEEQKDQLEGVAELIVAKQRNGPVGSVAATFTKEYARFEGVDYRVR